MSSTLAAPSYSLMTHQEQIRDFLLQQPFAGAWLGVGAGKTLTTLDVLRTLQPTGHYLVVAPVAIARSTWLDEIEEHRFPIRTKSLIADENDKQLTKEQRLARFQEVFTDPPTMYFVNQELLTQTSYPTRVLVMSRDASLSQPVSNQALELLRFLVGHQHLDLTRDALVEQFRLATKKSAAKPTPKSHVLGWLKELTAAGVVVTEARPCSGCSGEGCARCTFGLVDQMPVIDHHGQRLISWPFQTVIIDESQAFKSHTSKRFKALASVRPAVSRLIELTGTPAPNGLHDLWTQVYLLDQGEALGENITTFRNRWFTPQMVPGTTTPAKWIANVGAEQEIYAAIDHLVMSAKNTNLNLPALTFEDVNVSLPPDLMQAYKDFKRELVLDVVNTAVLEKAETGLQAWLTNSSEPEAQTLRSELSLLTGDAHATRLAEISTAKVKHFIADPTASLVNTVVAENQAVLTSKLMQFASGTLYTSDPDDPSTKGAYQVIHDSKLEMAEYLVRNNGGEPMLLAYHFKSDCEQLLARFKKAGIDARKFDGSRSMVRDWNAKKIQVMLLHPAAAGHGLNLQHGGADLIWYTLPFSLEHWIQTNGRVFRTGQTKPVTIYRLITKGTQDERMPSVLAEKEHVQDQLIAAVSGDHAFEQRRLAALQAEILEDLSDLWLADRA